LILLNKLSGDKMIANFYFAYILTVDFFSVNLFTDISREQFITYMTNQGIGENELETILLSEFLTTNDNGLLSLDFNNPIIISTKKNLDILAITQLENKLQHEIFFLKNKIISELGKNVRSIFLIGSTARNQRTLSSDIDMLMILDKNLDRTNISFDTNTQIIKFTTHDFENLYTSGDELIFWTMKYGIILHDDGYLPRFYNYKTSIPYHLLVQNKRMLIENLTNSLRESRNIHKKLYYKKLSRLAYQIARYIILLNKELPLSKKELVKQTKKFDEKFSTMLASIDENQDIIQLIKTFHRIKTYFNTFRE